VQALHEAPEVARRIVLAHHTDPRTPAALVSPDWHDPREPVWRDRPAKVNFHVAGPPDAQLHLGRLQKDGRKAKPQALLQPVACATGENAHPAADLPAVREAQPDARALHLRGRHACAGDEARAGLLRGVAQLSVEGEAIDGDSFDCGRRVGDRKA
jgi:hypothetical protein